MSSADTVRACLLPLNTAQIKELAALSGASESFLTKFRLGFIDNPRLDTVNKFLPFIAVVLAK